MKDCIGKYQFGLLFKVAKLMQVFPHLNTSAKRIFSMGKKNKTPFRAFQHFGIYSYSKGS